jgi:acyl-CoA synthetase (AMP-forming)/AMP-acid ligase II
LVAATHSPRFIGGAAPVADTVPIKATGRNIYPTDIEKAASGVNGVRTGSTVAVRLHAGLSRESLAVVVESNDWNDEDNVHRIRHDVAHQVISEVDVPPTHRDPRPGHGSTP